MQIDPKVSYYLNVALGLLTAVGMGVVSFTDFVDAATAHKIAAGALLAAFALNMILHGYSGPIPGPGMPPVLAPTPTPMLDPTALQRQAQQGTLAQPPKVVALLVAGALLWLLLPGAAYAQAPRLTGNPVKDFGPAARQNAQGAVDQSALDLVDKLQKLSLADFQYALALAQATKNVVSIPCWQAWVDLLTAQQSPLMGPGAPVLDAAGKPTVDASGKPILGPPQVMTEPDPHLITNVERISELLANLRPDSPISTSCAALAGAAGKDAANLIGGIMSGGALGLFKLPIPIP